MLDFSQEEIEGLMKGERMIKLMKLLDSDEFLEELDDCTDFELEEYLTTMKSLFNDTKSLSHLMVRLKDLINASRIIIMNISVIESVEQIVQTTCNSLQCEKV